MDLWHVCEAEHLLFKGPASQGFARTGGIRERFYSVSSRAVWGCGGEEAEGLFIWWWKSKWASEQVHLLGSQSLCMGINSESWCWKRGLTGASASSQLSGSRAWRPWPTGNGILHLPWLLILRLQPLVHSVASLPPFWPSGPLRAPSPRPSFSGFSALTILSFIGPITPSQIHQLFIVPDYLSTPHHEHLRVLSAACFTNITPNPYKNPER